MSSKKTVYIMGKEDPEERRREAARRKKIMERKKKRRRKIMLMKIGVMSLLILVILLIILLIAGLVKLIRGNSETDLAAVAEEAEFIGLDKVGDGVASIQSFYTYGVHFNMQGTLAPEEGKEIKYLELCMENAYDVSELSEEEEEKKGFFKKRDEDTAVSDDEEAQAEADTSSDTDTGVILKYQLDETGVVNFYTSELINEGICLEDIKEGDYCYVIRAAYSDGTNGYYTLADASGMEAVDYYTLTKDGGNREITISFGTEEAETKRSYMEVTCEKKELPEDVYDVVIDAGHGGTDTGAITDTITEAELTLSYARDLKEALEKEGYKVKLTRDGTESKDLAMAYTMYDEDGRVNVACASSAKVCFCIHFNQNDDVTTGGVEIYCTSKGNIDFASQLADHIVEEAGTTYSAQNTYKVASGVYERTYTDEEIADSNAAAAAGGYEPYNINTGTDYLFMIRELGGFMTGAYVDGRNTAYGTNLYTNSNHGVESFLLELGYMGIAEELKNLVSNQDAYVAAMKNAFVVWAEAL